MEFVDAFGEKTSNDVFELLSTIQGQLAKSEDVALRWRRDIDATLLRIEDTARRIENAQRR